MKKKAIAVLCFIFMLSFTATVAMASVMIVYGSEDKGYLVASFQIKTNKATYDDSSLNAAYKGYTKYAVDEWKKTGAMTYTRNTSSANKVKTYSNANTLAVAHTMTTYNVATGKISRFMVEYNRHYMDGRSASRNKATAAHEFGHPMGLMDLYKQKNKNVLMYGITNRTVSAPTAKDVTGAKYATGKR